MLLVTILVFCSQTSFARKPLAFPTAEGYGKYATGGRGGKVYEVTNLDASGEGSLRAALEAEGPRTVVFRVSGTIDADLKIENDFITIAGQTAPGDGITIKGQLGISANEVIIRYIRVRAEGRGDAISGRYNKNVIFDHVSASWSSDEAFTIYHGEYVTIQWCMITEACGGSHKFGGIWGNNYSTYHHNLIAHNLSRNPRFASGGGYNDYRNNVTYNWAYETAYGGEKQQPTRASSNHEMNKKMSHFAVNMVANYFKPGPGTQADGKNRICSPWSRHGADDYGRWYVADNYVDGSPEVTADNWKGVFPKDEDTEVDLDAIDGLKLDEPIDFMPINQQTAEAAYLSVLEHAGCLLPKRDSIDLRIIEDVRNGTATNGENGFVHRPTIGGGWPELKSAPAPADTDHDGMPDEWENRYGLDANDAADGSKDGDSDGYTNVEEYLNGTDPTVSVDYSKNANNINTRNQAVDPRGLLLRYMPADEAAANRYRKYVTKELGELTLGIEGTGQARTIAKTIVVPPNVTYDGKGEVVTADAKAMEAELGDQSEGQKPLFLLAPGAGIENVTITAPGCEGIHMMGDNVLDNIHWEDVGEAAASVRSYFPGGKITIKNSKAFKAADKMFQFNTPCHVRIENFVGDDMGKLVKNMWHKDDVPFYVDLNNVKVTHVKNAVVQSENPKCQARYHNLSYTFQGRFRPERVFRNSPPDNVAEY